MPQQQQQFELKPTYVRPITCICGGTAYLIRSVRHPLILGGRTEIRTFQCYKCRQLTETTAEP